MSAGRSRITVEQRRLMLEFVKRHPSIATGRFEGPDGARMRNKLLSEMAEILNSHGSDGATKSPEKWLRSWQDWKSDVKKKAGEIARHVRGAGRSTPRTTLTKLEEEVIELIKTTSSTGTAPDPLEGTSQPYNIVEVDVIIENETVVKEEPVSEEAGDGYQSPSTTPPPRPPPPLEQEPVKKRKKNNDLIDERMVDAMEKQAGAISDIAAQLSRLADIGTQILAMWVKSQNNTTESKETTEIEIEPFIG